MPSFRALHHTRIVDAVLNLHASVAECKLRGRSRRTSLTRGFLNVMERPIRIGSLLVVAALLAACGGGGSGGAQANNPGGQNPPPTVNLTANPTTISAGGTSTLQWTSTNATSCTASDGWTGSRATSGTFQTAALNATTTFTLSCSGAGGGALARVTVTVAAANSPLVQLSANPPGVAAGGSTTLNWTSSNVTSCTASGGWSGSKATSGSQSVGPLQNDTSYSLNCSGPGGNAFSSTTVTVRLARLSWQAPTQNVDGSALTNLAGYRVYWGSSPRNYSQSALVNGGTTTQHQVTLTAGTWYFAVTARNTDGGESGFSNEVSKTVF
jgi:azurin